MISVIVCSANDMQFAQAKAAIGWALPDEPHELIRIDDARSKSEGYNRGIAQSKGDIVMFIDDDVEILCNDFAKRLHRHMSRCDVLGIAGTMKLAGPTWTWAGPPFLYGQLIQWAKKSEDSQAAIYCAPDRHVDGMQALDGMLLVAHRAAVEAIGFDEQTFGDFHYELDFTFRAHLAGRKLAVACDFDVISHAVVNFGDAWENSAQTFLAKHSAQLGPVQVPPQWLRSSVRVSDRDQAILLLRPPHWKDE